MFDGRHLLASNEGEKIDPKNPLMVVNESHVTVKFEEVLDKKNCDNKFIEHHQRTKPIHYSALVGMCP